MRYIVKVLLEDSNKVKDLEQQILDLKEENRVLKQRTAEAESKYILEMQRCFRYQDELREAHGTIRYLRDNY